MRDGREVGKAVQISAENQVRVGRELRQEREKRNVALEEMAHSTRILVRHLQSLEADLFDELPGGVIRKGIVRSYCQHLGLDDQHWVERVAEAGGLDESEPDLAQFAANVHRARLETMPPVRHRWWGVALLAVALLGLAFAVWRYVVQPRTGLHLNLHLHRPGSSPPTPSTEAAPPATPAPSE